MSHCEDYKYGDHGPLCPSLYDDDNVECDRNGKQKHMTEANRDYPPLAPAPGKVVQMFTFMGQSPAVLTESGDIFVLLQKEPGPGSKKANIFWDHIPPPTAADLSKAAK